MSLHTVLRNFPIILIAMSSANPNTTFYPVLSHTSKYKITLSKKESIWIRFGIYVTPF
jgi:hypothetical protein